MTNIANWIKCHWKIIVGAILLLLIPFFTFKSFSPTVPTTASSGSTMISFPILLLFVGILICAALVSIRGKDRTGWGFLGLALIFTAILLGSGHPLLNSLYVLVTGRGAEKLLMLALTVLFGYWIMKSSHWFARLAIGSMAFICLMTALSGTTILPSIAKSLSGFFSGLGIKGSGIKFDQYRLIAIGMTIAATILAVKMLKTTGFAAKFAGLGLLVIAIYFGAAAIDGDWKGIKRGASHAPLAGTINNLINKLEDDDDQPAPRHRHFHSNPIPGMIQADPPRRIQQPPPRTRPMPTVPPGTMASSQLREGDTVVVPSGGAPPPPPSGMRWRKVQQ